MCLYTTDSEWETSSNEIDVIQALSNASAPAMKTMNFGFKSDWRDNLTQTEIFTSGAPILQRIALHYWAPHLVLPPLQSVTTLSLHIAFEGVLANGWSARFEAMPLLTHLRLCLNGKHEGSEEEWLPIPNPFQEPTTIPGVQTLVLQIPDDEAPWDIALKLLDFLTMPLLHEISVECDSTHRQLDHPYSHLRSVGPVNYPSLKRLRGLPALNSNALVTLSRAFPFVTEIHFAQRDWTMAFENIWYTFRWRLHTLGIPNVRLQPYDMGTLRKTPQLSPIMRLELSPQFVENARELIAASGLLYEVMELSIYTPFPMADLEMP